MDPSGVLWSGCLPSGPGVEVTGLELSSAKDVDVEALVTMLNEHKVVVVRGANLTTDEHLDLARRFGPIRLPTYLADWRSRQPSVLVMDGTRALAHTFHTDESFLDAPPAVCILRMHTMPTSGGDTTWIDLERAYAALPEPMKDRLDGVWAVHRTPDGDREIRHPVVRAHPRTARPALYVNRLYTRSIEGAGDTGPLLDALLVHSEAERFSFRLRWSRGDVVIWDNCCTMHRVANDFDTYRRVERVAVGAERPSLFGRHGSDR